MDIVHWLKQAETELSAAGIGTARLDTLVLLEDVMGLDRARLLAEPAMKIPLGKLAKLKNLLNRRATHEPLAYIRGKTEFYGREFVLTPAVLEPRPESETMIGLLKALPPFTAQQRKSHPAPTKPPTNIKIADVGTGSGALGITAKLELPHTTVDLLELDPAACQVAKINVDKFTPGVKIIESDLLAQATTDYDILLCNLPYVPDGYQINQAASQEPRMAIFGGPDGLDVYRRLFQTVAGLAKRPLYILCESLPPQHTALAALADTANYDLVQTDDFIQLFTRSKIA